MRQVIILFILFLPVINTNAQSPKEMADIFWEKYTALNADHFKASDAKKISGDKDFTKYIVPAIIEADTTILTETADELSYELTFNRNNGSSVKKGKDIVKAMKILAKNKGFQLVLIDDDFATLYNGAEQIMQYKQEKYVNIFPNQYLHFIIYAKTPYSRYLAAETENNYAKKISPSTAPQAVQLADPQHKRAIIMNGIFSNNKLIKGAYRITGYNPFIDGTWLSRKWNDDKETSFVCFIPENSKDTISGLMTGIDFGTFRMDYRYFEGSKTSRIAGDWVKNVYTPVEAERKLKAQKEYEDYDRKNHSYTIDDVNRDLLARQHQNSNQSTSASRTPAAGSTYSSFTKCSVCNGKGYTEYDCGQGGGKFCRKTCTACNGIGQVHN